MTNDTYRVGIDVGRNSVGLCALAVDDAGMPIKFLNSSVFIHDAGVDPTAQKSGHSRKKVAGIARRTRRLYRNRRYRLRALDKFLVANGYPIVNLESFSDPYTPWKMRLQLLTEKLPEADMKVALSVAVRHIARHRGWRSPYEKVATLYQQKDPSDELLKLREKVLHATGVDTDEDVTPAELISEILGWGKIRGEAAKSKSKSSEEKSSAAEVERNFSGKLRQSDNANEIRKYGQIQGLDTDFVRALIDKVFYAKSPVGSAQGKIGHDSLPGQQHLLRAEKADPIFQRYRIVSTLMNLRIKVAAGEERSLDKEELLLVTEYLMNYSTESAPNWGEVAEKLGIERASLRGTATLGPDGERASLRPPINVTGQRILENKKSAALKSWWKEATPEEQSCLISLLSFAQNTAEDEPGYEGAFGFLQSLDDIELAELDTLELPAGRAAYSRESLMRLTNRMLEDGVDLYEARRLEFGVAEDWKPAADPIGEPVGNPGVDRVLKIVNRWLQNVTKKWGAPAVINIEHVREAFGSEEKAREYDREINRRYERNQKITADLLAEEPGMSRVDARDITKYLAVRRQDLQCLYCGDVITFSSAEMDHIIPRRGVGATNKRENLAAVCRQCNQKKSNIPLAVWVAKQSSPYITMDAIRERVYNWKNYDGLASKQWKTFKKDVLMRLGKMDADPEIDGRSMESVAWMARELQKRIEYFYRESGTEVQVFRGQLTAEARKASGFEKRVQFIGGSGKTRLGRRHHAMDAAVISLMDFNIATTLAERTNLRTMQRYRRRPETWKTYAGRSEKMQLHYAQWQQKMEKLLEIFNELLREDLIPVMYPIRLQLGNSALHDANAEKLGYKVLGEAWSPTEVDRAVTPQMWTALTRLPEYSRESGLPEDSERCLRVKGQYFQASAALPILNGNKKDGFAAAIMLRGGAYSIGSNMHHGRIYRIPGKTPSYGVLRVYSYDLQPYRKEDLFTVQLPDSSLSMRTADIKVRRAIENGSAEYLGWIVVGDEIEVDFSDPYFQKNAIGEFLTQYPEIRRFRVIGFGDSTEIKIKPLLLAAEGLPADATKAEKKIIDWPGYRVAVNTLFSKAHPRIIRRNTLGEIRRNGEHSSLPLSWQI